MPDYTRGEKGIQCALHPLLSNIFTPQVIINGKTELEAPTNQRIRAAIDSELTHTVNPVFDASPTAPTIKPSTSLTLAGKGAGEFRAALVQVQASTAVKNGENAGKQLRHADIVRDLKSSGKRSGSLKLSLPGRPGAR